MHRLFLSQTPWGLKCCISGRAQDYEWNYKFHSPFSHREVTLMQKCFILSTFVWVKGHERMYIFESICCQAYVTLFHITITLFLSTGWGDIKTGTKKMYLECSHFEEWVPVLLYRLVCCPVDMQRDVNCISFLPVCRHCGYYLFSSVSKII